jgi:hypothetical protein
MPYHPEIAHIRPLVDALKARFELQLVRVSGKSTIAGRCVTTPSAAPIMAVTLDHPTPRDDIRPAVP